MSGPERIWAWVYADPWGNELRWFEWEDHKPEPDDTEYIRADIHDEVVKALREAVDGLEAYVKDEYDFPYVDAAMRGIIDRARAALARTGEG